MRRLAIYLIVFTCISSMAFASKSDDSQNEIKLLLKSSVTKSEQELSESDRSQSEIRPLLKSSVPKSGPEQRQEQLRAYNSHYSQAARLRAETKKARQVEGRRQEAKVLEIKRENDRRPTQDDYIWQQSEAYMKTYFPFMSSYKEGMKIDIPEILRPRTTFFMPHRDGMIAFNLMGYFGSFKIHVQELAFSFFDEVVAQISPQSCNIHENIYFEKKQDQLKYNLSKWLEKHVRAYEAKATRSKMRREWLFEIVKPGIIEVPDENNCLIKKYDLYKLTNVGLETLLTLQEIPEIPELTIGDNEALFNMIKMAELVPVKVTSANRLITNYQWVR
jgi:hypothetical protein